LAGRNGASLPAEAFSAKAGSLHFANLTFNIVDTESEPARRNGLSAGA
jgi:hypothetical protein